LIQAGFDPSRIEAHTQGIPRLAVAVEPGEAAEVAMLIDAAESSDPDGFPSFLELARRHIAPRAVEPVDVVEQPAHASSFVVGWRPVDHDREVIQTTTEMNVREAYERRGD
jgi:hypothetical protein